MAALDVAITSASGETDFVNTGPEGRGFIGVTGTISAGAILLVVKINQGTTEYVADSIDATVLAATPREDGSGTGSFFEAIQISSNGSFALKASSTFSGSVTVSALAERY